MQPSDSKPTRLNYDSRVIVPPASPARANVVQFSIRAFARLPGLVLLGVLILIVPSLVYAAVDPFFGGRSTREALADSLTAGVWALPAVAILILRWVPAMKRRRRPGPVTTNRAEKSSG
jgi:hypothetical protein